MAVDDVGRLGDVREIVDDGNRVAPDLGGDRAETRAVDHRCVAAPQQPERDVPHVQLRAGSVCQDPVGQQDAQRRVRRCRHCGTTRPRRGASRAHER